VEGPPLDAESVLAMMKRFAQPPVRLDHWHLSVDGTQECGPFSLLATHAVDALSRHFTSVEQSCDAYPTRTQLRCDVCPACRTYDRLSAVAHRIGELREMYFVNHAAFEVQRCDMAFDEVLPSGARLRVALRNPKLPCFLHDELDFQ
jgi:hypothetical protein